MGCFLGCFGFSSNRRRRKISRRILPRDQRHGSYQPLDSSVSINLDVTEGFGPKLVYQQKEQPAVKIKKKVSFNPNVQTYEPIPKTSQDFYSDDEDEKKEEERKKKMEDRNQCQRVLMPEEKKPELKVQAYPSAYRYRDCVESYYEEDEIDYEESDLDEDEYYYSYDDEDETDDDSFDVDEHRIDREEICHPKGASNSKEAESVCSNNSGRGRYTSAVLNPVENLAQWKAVKAKTIKQQTKENVSISNHDQTQPLLHDTAVDASLSNWLASKKKNYHEGVLSGRSIAKRSPLQMLPLTR